MVGIIASSVAGATLTYFFTQRVKWSTVKSSAILSLFFSCALMLTNHYYPFNHELYSCYFFGASFVGMTGKERLSYLGIAVTGLLYALVLFAFSNYFSGIGGALGSTACITVIIVFLTKQFGERLNKLQKK